MNTPGPRSTDRSLAKSIGRALLLLLLPLLYLGGLAAAFAHWLTWPLYRRWKQRPFDAAVWKNNPPSRMGAYTTEELAELDPSGEKHLSAAPGYDARDARYWMVHDAIRRIRGKSREEVLALLGEPDGPSSGRGLVVDSPDSWHMAYGLSPEGLFGRSELLIRLDDRGRVKDAKLARSAS
jgi:hypothetical protein